MRLETTAGQLRAALYAMGGIVQKYNTVPVLGAVKFEGGRISGTDLDKEVTVTLPTIGEQVGAAAIDYFGLVALARHVDDGETLTISEDDGLAVVTFNGSEYRMASYPVADYPDFDDPSGAVSRTGNAGLVAAMKRVRFAISTEETRYYLNGVAILDSSEGTALLVATDGHRLAMMPLPAAPDGSNGCIIPVGVVQFLVRMGQEPASCVFDAGRGRASFELAGGSLRAKLIDGKYPDIFRVVPRDPTERFAVDRVAALRVLKRLRSFILGRYRGVKLTGTADGLRLTIGSSDRGAAETVGWAGRWIEQAPEAFECGYNVDYLIDAFRALIGDTVTFACCDNLAGSPALLTSDDDALRIVQMPMRV